MSVPKKRVIFATCDHLPEITASDQVLAAALERRGVTVEAGSWAALAPGAGEVVVIRSTWDYHTRPDEFQDWLTRMEQSRVRLINPVGTLRWNLDKHYLARLEGCGVAIPRTLWVDGGAGETELRALLREAGWVRAVLKPRIGATAHGAVMVEPSGAVRRDLPPVALPGGLLQEYVPEIVARGELSLMFFGDRLSHAILKRPAPGDFRVQTDFGGSAALVAPSPAAVAFAERVLAVTPVEWTYARVDLVETARGPRLMELELIEPHLFFDLAPEAAPALAERLASLLV